MFMFITTTTTTTTTSTTTTATTATTASANGESQHFCDDPVCPGPVWKLSTIQRWLRMFNPYLANAYMNAAN